MMHSMHIIWIISLQFTFQSLTSVTYIPDESLLDLQNILTDEFDNNCYAVPGETVGCGPEFFKPFAGTSLRLIFSDCEGPAEGNPAGGPVSICDGCIAENEGIHRHLADRVIIPLDAIYLDPINGFYDMMSRADFWAFTATYAINFTAINADPDNKAYLEDKLPYYFGRKDCSTSPNVDTTKTTIKSPPSVIGDWSETFKWMNDNFGLDEEQTVALMGAHTIGKAHPDDSGFNGPFKTSSWANPVSHWGTFDNRYYEDIQKGDWRQDTISTPDGDSLKQWEITSPNAICLNTDIGLYRDLSDKTDDGTVTCADGSDAGNCPENTATNGFVVNFANDNEAWLNKFIEAYTIMVTAGYDINKLTKVFATDLLDGQPAVVSGDPHFSQFDGSKHDLQGNPKTSRQFYYLVSCDISDKTKVPYTMIGKHTNLPRSKITGLDYITLELFDNNDVKYLVFLSASIRKYTTETDGVSSLYDTNVKNGVSLTTLSSGSTNIGDRFVITLKLTGRTQIDVTLTIDGKCQLIFMMKAQRSWWKRYRMHYLRVTPPSCYKRYICGILGDFKKRKGLRSQKMTSCNGDTMTIKDGMGWSKIYDPYGMSWEKSYVDAFCNGEYVPETTEAPQVCDNTIRDQVIVTCQRVRDEQKACCNAIGVGFCDAMQTWCEIDACITSDGDANEITSNVYDLFTAEVVETCEHCKGCFGPIPKLLYEFDGDLHETQSDGDDKYKLQTFGDAYVANGVLNCDGSDDFAFSEYNLDFSMKSHSLEVLVSLDGLLLMGGGTISIDSNYTSNEPNSGYQHNQFDSIVYNELNDRRWFSGSELLQRTQTSVGTQEYEVKEYIHLVTTYDVNNNKVKLYRNGIKEQDYTPSGFLQVVKNEGYRIMFCQRYMGADGDDFKGKIKFGAIYNYALSEEEVEILYHNSMVQVFGIQYEVIGDDLLPDKTLQTGQALRSTNQRYVAVLQRDGNFVAYDLSETAATASALFATNTADAVSDETRYIIYQSGDGNLALYRNNPYSGIKWDASITDNDGTGFLMLENDGNLVIYNGNGEVKWSTNHNDNGNDAKFDLFSLDMLGDKSEHPQISSFGNNNNSYLMYFVGGIVLILMIVNIICIYSVYFKNKQQRKYKVISMESTDVETDTDIQN